MESTKITLASKPNAQLAINTYKPKDPHRLPYPLDKTLLVFLNGLAAPQSSWGPTINLLLEKDDINPVPALVTYDRYGQGASDPDPSDPPDTPYGHDAAAVINDLYHLLMRVIPDIVHMDAPGQCRSTRIVFVCNSIGCPLARLYAAANPGTVAGFLFLDSMMANSDFVSVQPDPDAADFDPAPVPEGISVDDLRHAREQYRKFFHPTVPNGEKFDRRDMPQRLPFADKPLLPPGPDGKPPVVYVAGHDFDRFAQDGQEGFMHIPKAVTNAYMNPAWHEYNRGLTKLTTRDNSPKEPVIAEGCGHVIQLGSPGFVAEQVTKLLSKLREG
ncbi:Alpha/beta hydrolase fold-1 [Coniochaeta sp. 2T2.1]|nr:Alpha/beta hydrolase fold-1 [Coniochaeta sp. 2T2.1]